MKQTFVSKECDRAEYLMSSSDFFMPVHHPHMCAHVCAQTHMGGEREREKKQRETVGSGLYELARLPSGMTLLVPGL